MVHPPDCGAQPAAPISRFTVRRAVPADFSVLRDLQYDADRLHAEHAPEVHHTPDPPRYTAQELGEVAACENCCLLVAEQEGEVVGFIEVSVRLSFEPYEPDLLWCGINNLAVRPGHCHINSLAVE